MRRLTLNLTIAAAALTVAAATASAQSLKAEIPFAFQTGASRLQPGTYYVNFNSLGGSLAAVRLQNLDNGRSVFTMPVSRDDAPVSWKATRSPVIEFACTEGRCSLARIWTGDGSARAFEVPKAKAGEHMASILVRAERTE